MNDRTRRPTTYWQRTYYDRANAQPTCTAGTAAAVLGVTAVTVRRMLLDGRLRGYTIERGQYKGWVVVSASVRDRVEMLTRKYNEALQS